MIDLIIGKEPGTTNKDVERRMVSEETNSLQRWEESNAKFVGQYEKAFITFYHSKNPFLKYDSFTAPTMGSLREKQIRERRRFNNSFTENGSQSLAEHKIPSKPTHRFYTRLRKIRHRDQLARTTEPIQKKQQEYLERNEYKTNNRHSEVENIINNRKAGKHNNGNFCTTAERGYNRNNRKLH